MKQIRLLTTWLAVCAVALVMATTATAQSSKERVGTVTKIKGAARVSSGNNIWRPLKVGDVLRAGAIVQTAGGSYVDIVFSDAGAAVTPGGVAPVRAGAGAGAGAGGGKLAARQDVIRLVADTVVAIDKLSSVDTGADKVTETQLDLRSGKLFGDVSRKSAASRFEVKIPNGVAGIRGTTFSMTADGVVSVLSGTVVIAWEPPGHPAGQPLPTREVRQGYRFDIKTGTETEIPAAELAALREMAALGLIPVSTTIEYVFDQTIYYVSPKVENGSSSSNPPGGKGNGK